MQRGPLAPAASLHSSWCAAGCSGLMKITDEKLAIQVIAEQLSRGLANTTSPRSSAEVTLELMRECLRGRLEDEGGNSYLTYQSRRFPEGEAQSVPHTVAVGRSWIARMVLGRDWQTLVDRKGWETFATTLRRSDIDRPIWGVFRGLEINGSHFHRWKQAWEKRTGDMLPDFWAEPSKADSRAVPVGTPSALDQEFGVGRPSARLWILQEYHRQRKERQKKGEREPSNAAVARDLETWAKKSGNIPEDIAPPKARTIERFLHDDKKS